MSERSYHDSQTQGIKHIDYKFTILPQGTVALGPTGPLLGEGDIQVITPTGTSAGVGSFVKAVRGASGVAGATGVTGTFLVTTQDSFAALVYATASISLAGGPNGNSMSITFETPIQNSDRTWTIPFQILQGTTLFDPPVGSAIYVSLRFRNSITVP